MPHAGDPLENPKRGARRLLQAVLNHDPQALKRVENLHPRFPQISKGVLPRAFRREDAQYVVAREAGFATWAALKRAPERRPSPSPGHSTYEEAIALLNTDRFKSDPHETLKEELRKDRRPLHPANSLPDYGSPLDGPTRP